MNQEPVLVDTSAWICFFARKGFPQIKKTVGSLLDENRVAVVGPVVIELIQECRNETEKTEVERCLQGLRWLSVQDHHWHLSAQLAFDLRRKGVTVSAIDVLIATITMNYGCRLLHQDRDYDFMAKYCPELKLYKLRQP